AAGSSGQQLHQPEPWRHTTGPCGKWKFCHRKHSASIIDGAVEGALYHHEKYDGSGYPFGLRGETIPLHSRIICIADAFDAMNSDRAYRKRCNEEYIISELKRCRGTHFDPHLVDVLFACLEKRDITIG
ncbi:MAG: HD domain-containing protein, partial [Oscillospiraceae bacterium]|nr:HD domain-containing protein [Oscillospiraceae bacterium]